jgi:hypothetical protein
LTSFRFRVEEARLSGLSAMIALYSIFATTTAAASAAAFDSKPKPVSKKTAKTA